MHLLNVKLLRDIWRSRWQFIAVVAIVMLGIAFYQAAWTSYLNIGSSYETYYRMTNFHDFEIPCKSAPDSVAEKIERLPGISAAHARIVQESQVDLREDGDERVVGRFISVPNSGRAAVDDIIVQKGIYPGAPHKKQILVEKTFAEHHELDVGDYIHPVVYGEQFDYRIVGIAVSPEYIYAIESKQYLMPTPQTFGVFWVRRGQAEDLFGLASRASSVVARASDDLRQRAMQIVHGMLAGYGAEEPVPREDQPSNYLLQMDLEGYKSMAVFFPLLFLFCAALTIYTLMVRIVNSQRNQIGFLRASGVPVHVLTRHYLLYSLICGGLGSVLGVSLGLYLSWLLTRFYLQF
ncbi:MAG: FtsX-like permease family protein, partial [Armatimonadota bacterium]